MPPQPMMAMLMTPGELMWHEYGGAPRRGKHLNRISGLENGPCLPAHFLHKVYLQTGDANGGLKTIRLLHFGWLQLQQ